MKAKTRKSITKRFKMIKKGKTLRRPSGQCHNRAKRSGNKVRKDRKMVEVSDSEIKKIKKILKG